MQNAISIIREHQKHLKPRGYTDNEIINVSKGLEMGIKNLNGRIKLIEDDVRFEKLMSEVVNMKYSSGFGLSKGFGEFLWQGYDWQVEVMDAVNAIEDYWRKM
jgi:hypothetical protein